MICWCFGASILCWQLSQQPYATPDTLFPETGKKKSRQQKLSGEVRGRISVYILKQSDWNVKGHSLLGHDVINLRRVREWASHKGPEWTSLMDDPHLFIVFLQDNLVTVLMSGAHVSVNGRKCRTAGLIVSISILLDLLCKIPITCVEVHFWVLSGSLGCTTSKTAKYVKKTHLFVLYVEPTWL